jgi:uncharacterized alkaline shock family protein YloU
MLRIGYFSADDTVRLYGFLSQAQRGVNILSGFTISLLTIGLIFLYYAIRRTGEAETIVLKDKGQMVHIPAETFKDFINQILEKESSLSDFDTAVHRKGKWIYVDVASNFTGAVPVRRETSQIKEILKSEIERVFELPHFKITFQMKGINAARAKNRERSIEKNLGLEEETNQLNENMNEEDKLQKEEALEKMPWER